MASAKTIRRAVLAFVPVAAFIGLLTYGLLTSAPDVGAGTRLPDFELPRLDSAGVMTDEDLRGKPVVVNFWASWCIPCREEARLLQETYEEYSSEGVVFLGVNIKDSTVDARDFIDEYEMTYPVVSDQNEDLARALGVNGIPVTFFIDSVIVLVGSASGPRQEQRGCVLWLGPISEEALTTNIDVLLRRSG